MLWTRSDLAVTDILLSLRAKEYDTLKQAPMLTEKLKTTNPGSSCREETVQQCNASCSEVLATKGQRTTQTQSHTCMHMHTHIHTHLCRTDTHANITQ